MPKDYFISDVHIQTPDDEAAELFVKFLNICLKDRVQRVFLLGDIFDLMVGSYEEYKLKYKRIFEYIESLVHQGTQVYYFEGNHDFHLKRLFEGVGKNKNVDNPIQYVKGDFYIKTPQGRLAHISHGDDMEIENTSYKVYKALINNRFVELLTEQVFGFSFVENLGTKASADSKKRNYERYSKEQQQSVVRDKFRRSAEVLASKIRVDLIIAGHSHYRDDYQTSNGTRYVNNGYALQSQSFICSDENGVRFVEI